MRYAPIALVVCAAIISGCTAEPEAGQEEQDAVSMSGPYNRPGSATEVWEVRNAWLDTDPAAGVAWGENSGLTWEEKFVAWTDSLEIIERHSYGKTFKMKTPYGDRALQAPWLDCGEVAYLLRLGFASWYHLPFYMKGWHNGGALYAGHMGFVTKDGYGASGFPNFKNYPDFEGSWQLGDAWPSDPNLRKKRLGDDDRNEFLETEGGPELGAGAYFDEIFLNKRVGYFARYLMLYYGSVNLASGANTYHIEASALRPGDTLLKRHQKNGSGHTVPILTVEQPIEGKFAVEVAWGNVPRSQPKYEDTLAARRRFTSNVYGGHGENSDGDAYASLGGGLKRWRQATLKGGRWHNLVPQHDVGIFIQDSQHDRIAERVDIFDEILITGSPEESLAAAEGLLERARDHLTHYPASCSKRTEREQALAEIYKIQQEDFGKTVEELDEQYRTLADYVLAELVYENSKTCCWNSTTDAMYEIVMAYAEREQAEAEASGMCVTPTVFRAENAASGVSDGYDRWRDYASDIGRGHEWVDWSEDEACAQRGITTGELAPQAATAWCPAG